MAEDGPTLTLRDIADLADVERAVVSMWRRRPRSGGGLLPFPAPVPGTDRVERFRRDEIVEWLTSTGRGNNLDHRLDAPALSPPAGVLLEDLVTLLCLYAHGDGDLADLTGGELEALVQRADPHDRFLRTEMDLLELADGVLGFIDDLVEATYGLPEALERLERGPAGRALGQRDLTSDAVTLFATLVHAATTHLDSEGVPVVFSGGPANVALAIAGTAPALVVPGTDGAARALRRRALIHGHDLADETGGPQLRLRCVLGRDDEETLLQVDDLLLDLAPGEIAMVIAPASALCDRQRGAADKTRTSMLRTKRLVVALRLPRGLWREAPRQVLALWICAGGLELDQPMVADLGAFSPAEVSAEDLAADVVGALTRGDGRAYRYLRRADLARILAGSPVVPPGARAPRGHTAGARHLDRIQAAVMVTAEQLEPLDILVTAARSAMTLRERTLGDLKEIKAADVRRGCRIDPADFNPDGTIAVLSADSAMPRGRLDPFHAEHRYPRGTRTEAGDVVFAEGNPPRALVDERGGSLVASPSRILRLGNLAGVGPHTVAAVINHQAPSGGWQNWRVPALATADAEALEAALAGASLYSAALRRREVALHELASALIDGVAAGAIAVVPQRSTREGQ